ncbi:disease resistance protein RPV1-like isoform X1 [Fagus crenata]
MEDTGSVYFDYLVSMELIEPSTYDYSVNFDSYMSDEKFLVPPVFDSNGGTGKLYKVNEAKASYLEVASSEGGYLSVLDGKLDDASELTLHLSLPCESVDDQISLKTLKKCKYLRMLHLFSGCGYSVKRVPRDLFLSLKLLRTDDECGIEELMNMIDLSGTFCISRLERLSSLDKAKEAALIDKKYLSKLELRWSDIRVVKPEEEEEILECLRPHSGLREIQILFYGGSKLPSWISDPSFADLVAITLYKCRNCNLLPSLGELPSLEFLYIKEMNEVKEIDHQFCRNGKDKRNQGFAKLENLTIDVMLNLEEWMGVENGDLPALHKLTLECCPKLIALPSLWCLNFLEHLEIKHCPMLLCLPNEGLPTSLEFLLIKDCPELKERCCKGEGQEGQDWGKIKHVQNIWIDHQEVSSSRGF